MNEKRMRDALEAIARRGVPEDVNLMPNIAAGLERRTLMTTLRTRPVLMLVLVLLTLALLSGAAYAIGRMSGYIPGIGMVDQSVQLRVLAEPVTVTREGITLTVEQAVLSADKTVLIYKVEGIPADAYASEGEGEGGEPNSVSVSSSTVIQEGTPDVEYSSSASTQCVADEHLILPDGSIVRVSGGGMYGWLTGFESHYEYDPIPSEVNQAVFVVACIDGTTPGKLPENWEIPLRFVPAPPDMTIFPVIEATTPGESQSALTIEKVIETNDGYILMGKFRLIGYPSNVDPNDVQTNWVKITDGEGRIVDVLPFTEGVQSGIKTPGEFTWAYEIKGKQHTWPLTITMDAVYVNLLDTTAEFEFDAGNNPQVGQTWTLDPNVEIAGYEIREVSIKRTGRGYEFQFKVDPNILLFMPEIKGFPSSSGTGGNDGFGAGRIYYQLEYRNPPSGKLTVRLSDVSVVIYGPWEIQWSPEDTPLKP